MQPVTHQMIDYVNNNNEVERLFGFSQKENAYIFTKLRKSK
jgi:Holliday junction resolvasome RuvABC DNA-binding subunit